MLYFHYFSTVCVLQNLYFTIASFQEVFFEFTIRSIMFSLHLHVCPQAAILDFASYVCSLSFHLSFVTQYTHTIQWSCTFKIFVLTEPLRILQIGRQVDVKFKHPLNVACTDLPFSRRIVAVPDELTARTVIFYEL